MPSLVTQVPAAAGASALAHFEDSFRFETDCWDVHQALTREPDFVLIDVRGPDAFAAWLERRRGGPLPQSRLRGSG